LSSNTSTESSVTTDAAPEPQNPSPNRLVTDGGTQPQLEAVDNSSEYADPGPADQDPPEDSDDDELALNLRSGAEYAGTATSAVATGVGLAATAGLVSVGAAPVAAAPLAASLAGAGIGYANENVGGLDGIKGAAPDALTPGEDSTLGEGLSNLENAASKAVDQDESEYGKHSKNLEVAGQAVGGAAGAVLGRPTTGTGA
jgi:hypothetical protein